MILLLIKTDNGATWAEDWSEVVESAYVIRRKGLTAQAIKQAYYQHLVDECRRAGFEPNPIDPTLSPSKKFQPKGSAITGSMKRLHGEIIRYYTLKRFIVERYGARRIEEVEELFLT
jgi:hypothetical protein